MEGCLGVRRARRRGQQQGKRWSPQEERDYSTLAASLRRCCRARFLQSLSEPGGLLTGSAAWVPAVSSFLPEAEVCAAPEVAGTLPGKSQTCRQWCFVAWGFSCSSATGDTRDLLISNHNSRSPVQHLLEQTC